MKQLVIFGCGDIAELALFYFRSDSPYKPVAFAVDQEYVPSNKNFCGLPVVPFQEVERHFPPQDHEMFVALSYSQINRLRAKKLEDCKAKGYAIASYVSSRASVLTSEAIGENAFILEDNTIQPFARIGRNVTLWSGNHIGHHSVIGDHVFVASHVVVSGRVRVGDYCFLGVNATLRNAISVGDSCVIGMGAVMTTDCEPDGLYPVKGTERAKIAASRLPSI
jgi:sugar O-acyltransferase (sialic acid O-acetyltransferase NeuD family)